MTAHEALTFWYGDQPVADVTRVAGSDTELTLHYYAAWQDRRSAFPISVRFPLQKRDHAGTDIYFWLMNLLPEDEALKTVSMLLQLSDIDVLGLIVTLGGDLPGALVARPWGAPMRAGNPRLHPWTEAGLAQDILRLPERPLLAGDEGVQMSLAGQQAKLPVVRLGDGALSLPLDGHPSTHILKPRSPKLRCSVENEAYCMRLARECALHVADVELGSAEGIGYLLVRRYDRVASPGGILRLHQEDLCQATGYPPFRKYEWNARVKLHGPTAADLFQAVSVGPLRAPNRLRMLDAFIFNLAVDNVDSHAKNYSLLFELGRPELAPLYDVMCAGIYPGITRNLPQKVAGKQRGDHLSARQWNDFAAATGLSAPAVRTRVRRQVEGVLRSARPLAERLASEAAQSPFEPLVFGEIATRVEARCQRLLRNLEVSTPNGKATEAAALDPTEE